MDRRVLVSAAAVALALSVSAVAQGSADSELLGGAHALSVQVGPAMYSKASVPAFVGPKLTLGYAFVLARPVWLDLELGLASGACLRRGDEQDCIFRPGTAFEPSVGLRTETRLGARSSLFGKASLGALVLVPESLPVGVGAVARAGGGIRRFVSRTVALGLDLTGAVAVGRFDVDFGGAARTLVNLEAGLVLETRF